MRKSRIEIMLLAVTVVAMGAGVAAGLVAARLPSQSTAPAAFDRLPLVDELQLTADQRDQMRAIWESVRDRAQNSFEDAQLLQKQRDDSLVALLNDVQKAEFARISKSYAERYDNLTRKRDEAFRSAVERTKSILSETQKRKYDEILKERVGPDVLKSAATAPAN